MTMIFPSEEVMNIQGLRGLHANEHTRIQCSDQNYRLERPVLSYIMVRLTRFFKFRPGSTSQPGRDTRAKLLTSRNFLATAKSARDVPETSLDRGERTTPL